MSTFFPAQLNEATYKADISDPKARGLVQIIGVLVTCIGLFNVCAGRANSAWFITLTFYERLMASSLFAYVYLTGAISLQTLISQLCLDVGGAVYTYYLYQQEHKHTVLKKAEASSHLPPPRQAFT